MPHTRRHGSGYGLGRDQSGRRAREGSYPVVRKEPKSLIYVNVRPVYISISFSYASMHAGSVLPYVRLECRGLTGALGSFTGTNKVGAVYCFLRIN